MTSASSHKRGDELLERVAEGDTSAANDLLGEFFRGFPLDKLTVLLHSDTEDAAKSGAWIASELGPRIGSLVSDLTLLLHHPARYVRFFVLDALLTATTDADGQAIACAVSLIRDSDDAVRWQAMNLLGKATRSQLAAGLAHLEDGALADELRWLLATDGSHGNEDIASRFTDPDPLVRRFAGAAALRAFDLNPALLTQAASSSDEELQSFASGHLKVKTAGKRKGRGKEK